MGNGNIIHQLPDVNVERRLDVVQHAHPKNTWFNFKSPSLATSTVNYILVDFSDKTNYKFIGTDYIHLENVNLRVDSDVNGAYTISIGFLENVDAANGDFYEIFSASGAKKAGNSISLSEDQYPNGARCKSDFVVSSTVSLNDVLYQTDVNLATLRNPAAVDTPSGSGDLILKAVITAGNIIINANGTFHGH